MKSELLKTRTKLFAVNVIRFCRNLKSSPETNVIKHQLIKSVSSSAANYRAACRARSGREWYAKVCIVVEEVDETYFWLEMIQELELITSSESVLLNLIQEADELTRLFSKARKTYQSKHSPY